MVFVYQIWFIMLSLIIQMHKATKENHYLSAQTVDFFTRQLTYLNQIAHRINQLTPELVADQIKESVTLIEKRIVFILENKGQEQFHDYVADFYQNKLEQFRKQLNKQLIKNKQLEIKIQSMQKNIRSQQQSFIKSKPFDVNVVSQNMSLKNELLHSQRLIEQNQQMIEAQNNIIGQIKGCLVESEERQHQLRLKYEEKIKQFDDLINKKKKKILELTKEFESESKKLDRQFREVELQNISLVQEKDALQSELILKSQQIKLLSKKIYDQNLLIGKYEREMQLNCGILEEQKIGMNRILDDNRVLKDKLRQLQKESERRIDSKNKQIKCLQQKILNLNCTTKQLEMTRVKYGSSNQKFTVEIREKNEQIRVLQTECSELEQKVKDKDRQIKKLERKDKQNIGWLKQMQQRANQKEEEVNKYKDLQIKYKRQVQSINVKFQQEKDLIKKDLQEEFNHLVSLNAQILSSCSKVETQNQSLKKEIKYLSEKNNTLNDDIEQLSQTFEDAKKMMNRLEQEKQDIDYIREQLEIKLKHAQRKCEELHKITEQREVLSQKNIELQQNHHESKKLLREKQNELQKYKRLIKEDSVVKDNVQSDKMKMLKEELCKKEFMLRQSNSKLNEAQAELRQITRKFEFEKQTMKKQIHDMEKIIQDNFDHSSNSNRLLESSLV